MKRGGFYKHKNCRDLIIEIVHFYEGTDTYSLNYYTYNCNGFELGNRAQPFQTVPTRFHSKIPKEELSNWKPYSLSKNRGVLIK